VRVKLTVSPGHEKGAKSRDLILFPQFILTPLFDLVVFNYLGPRRHILLFIFYTSAKKPSIYQAANSGKRKKSILTSTNCNIISTLSTTYQMAPSQTPSWTFTLFLALLRELRLQIWEYYIKKEVRVVRIRGL
jgi:hypothetical protein